MYQNVFYLSSFFKQHFKIISDNKNSYTEEENIYQPIWKFQTVGEGQNKNFIDGRCESPVDYGLSEDDDGEWEPADDISYHTYYLNLNHCDTMKSLQSSSPAPPDIVQKQTSHKLNDDFQHESVSYRGRYNKNCDIRFQYKTICIIYSEICGNSSLRGIIYDYKPFAHLPKNDNDLLELHKQNQTPRENYKVQNAGKIETSRYKLMDGRTNHIEAWKSCLFMEDEEDMVRGKYIQGVPRRWSPQLTVNRKLLP